MSSDRRLLASAGFRQGLLASAEGKPWGDWEIIGACRFLEQHGGTAPQLHGHDRSAPKC
jgi:hypothetical protein